MAAEFITIEEMPDGQRKLKLNFHPGQLRAWESKKRLICILAGRQGGKTALGPPWLYREIQMRGPGDYLAVSPELSLARKKQIPEIKQYFKSYLNLGTLRESPDISFVFSPDGMRQTFGVCGDIPTTIRFGYAAKPESLEAMTVKACWSDEAGQKDYKLDSLYAIDGRLAVNRGRHLISTTPYNLGWLKQKIYDPWQKSGGTHPDIDVIQFDSTQNPAFQAEEFERLRESMPAWKFDLFYRAKFSRPAGLIYDCFDDARHKTPRFKIPDHWQRYLGVDFGGINTAGVFFAEEPGSRRLFAYREYHEGSRIAKNHVMALLKNEPMTPICCGGSMSEDQWREEFRDAGLPVQEPAVSEVEVGIDRVYALLSEDPAKIQFFDDLTETLGELASYSRKTDANGEVTQEIDDKSSYHLCFVGETKIETDSGPKPLSRIDCSDRIFTRKGLRRLECKMDNGLANVHECKLSDGRSLIGTRDHPFFVLGRGLIPMRQLNRGDIILSCEQKQLYSTALFSRDTQTRDTMGFGTTIGTTNREALCCSSIGRCGSRSMAIFRKDGIFTTKTMTQQTILQKTCNACHQATIAKQNIKDGEARQNLTTWRELGRLRGHGLPLKRDVSNAKREQSSGRKDSRLLSLFARFAGQSELLKKSAKLVGDSVRESAGSLPELIMRRGFADFATRSIPLTNIALEDSALVRVETVKDTGRSERVFNLSVEGEHEYFANGVLVSNCDSMRYILSRIRKPVRTGSPDGVVMPPVGKGNVVAAAPLGVFGRPRF